MVEKYREGEIPLSVVIEDRDKEKYVKNLFMFSRFINLSTAI